MCDHQNPFTGSANQSAITWLCGKARDVKQPSAVEACESSALLAPSAGPPCVPEALAVVVVDVTLPAAVLSVVKDTLCALVNRLPGFVNLSRLFPHRHSPLLTPSRL